MKFFICIICIYKVLSSEISIFFDYFSETPTSEQPALFIKKLNQCCVLFDFDDAVVNMKSKEIKRSCLNEIVEYITNTRGILTEPTYQEITKMVIILYE